MKIAIISDTHNREINPFIRKLFKEQLHSAQYIIHAGDLTSLAALNFFEMNHVIAVAGNSDDNLVRAKLPLKKTLTINGFTIGVAHGWGSYEKATHRARTLFNIPLDILISGHTHIAKINYCKYNLKNELWLNPGSASSFSNPSMMFLYLDEPLGSQVAPRVEIIKL